MVLNKMDALDEDAPYLKDFYAYIESLGRDAVSVSAATGEGMQELVHTVRERLETLPEITVYEPELTPEDLEVSSVGGMETTVRRQNDTYFVEGQWLLNFMGQINFDDYESLNFFQRVLQKNGVFDLLREKGIKDGDTVNIYDFEFDFVY